MGFLDPKPPQALYTASALHGLVVQSVGLTEEGQKLTMKRTLMGPEAPVLHQIVRQGLKCGAWHCVPPILALLNTELLCENETQVIPDLCYVFKEQVTKCHLLSLFC